MSEKSISEMTDAEFDAAYGGRDLLPIEQLAYEKEGAARFAEFHGRGRRFSEQAENWAAPAHPGEEGRN